MLYTTLSTIYGLNVKPIERINPNIYLTLEKFTLTLLEVTLKHICCFNNTRLSTQVGKVGNGIAAKNVKRCVNYHVRVFDTLLQPPHNQLTNCKTHKMTPFHSI